MRRKSGMYGLACAAVSFATLFGAPPIGAAADDRPSDLEVKRPGAHVLHWKGYFAQAIQPASRVM